jgi:hypothetical protein
LPVALTRIFGTNSSDFFLKCVAFCGAKWAVLRFEGSIFAAAFKAAIDFEPFEGAA